MTTVFTRAYSLHQHQQHAQAMTDYDTCAMLEPSHAPTFYNRACALYCLGRKAEAVQDLTKAIKLDAKNPLYIESRAILCKELGQFREAIHDYTWLNTLRHLGRSGMRPAQLPELGVSAPQDAIQSSFSLSFADLNDLLVSNPRAAVHLSDERENEIKSWITRFLRQKPQNRTMDDVERAADFTHSWRCFRDVDRAIAVQCLQVAGYAHLLEDQTVVHQARCSQYAYVVLNAAMNVVRNVDANGVSKLQELQTLVQGDVIGALLSLPACLTDDGRLRTLKRDLPAGRPRSGSYSALSSRVALPTSVSLPLLPREGESSEVRTEDHREGSQRSHSGELMADEPASISCLEDLHCLVLNMELYHDILQRQEVRILHERLAFLRGCRVFQCCSDDVLTALAAVSGAKIYDPGKEILRAGDVVTQLCLIKRGVCQVRKTIRVPPAQQPRAKVRCRQRPSITEPLMTSRSNDGSWVLDNGWMLTNPRLVNNAANGLKAERIVTEDVNIAVLASGQLFGELSVLQPGQSSQVTVQSQTMVEILVFHERDLAGLNIQYLSGTMNALQDSLLFHNPPQQKILQLRVEQASWEKRKSIVLQEHFNGHPPNCLAPSEAVSFSRLGTSNTRPRRPEKL